MTSTNKFSEGPQARLHTQQADWTRSDEYHNSFLIKPDRDLASSLTRSEENGLPDIAVSAAQGKFLHLLAKSIGAKRVLEVGTLGGYSTIWLAKALPGDGQVITLEVSEEHARVSILRVYFLSLTHSKVAEANWKAAGLSDKIKIIVDQAVNSLATLDSAEPFDLVFIDADKPSNVKYFQEAERLARVGGVIIVDNVVRHGRVADPDIKDGDDASVDGVRALLKYVQNSKRVEGTTIATVGTKGLDGYLFALKHE